MNLFTYGSLMHPEILRNVVGELFPPGVPATLLGWKRCPVARESYPAIVRADSASVSGILWTELQEKQLDALDAFEGRDYRRIRVTVTDAAGGEHGAFAYAWAREGGLIDGPWDFARFKAEEWLPDRAESIGESAVPRSKAVVACAQKRSGAAARRSTARISFPIDCAGIGFLRPRVHNGGCLRISVAARTVPCRVFSFYYCWVYS